MKKFLLSVILLASLGMATRTSAQCNGASVSITNFVVSPSGNNINWGFNWEFVQGNASIEVVFFCNGVQNGTLVPCLPRLKDSAAGLHPVSGSFSTTCSGTVRVEIRVWSSPTCGGTFCAIFREISHASLPVSFKTFTAIRSGTRVNIKWETAWEQNNTGFAIERNAGGEWQQVAWIPSRASNGNSEQLLQYLFSDANNIRGLTQYRIRQVDMDSRSKFSEVRSVRGDGQLGKIVVYPNPSNDGRIKVSFEDASAIRNISVADMNGRTMKEFVGITNNNITVEGLKGGIYIIKVTIPSTGEQSIQKIVVSKH
jgi:hypothetical protein